MPPRLTTEQFIRNSLKIHGEKYDYSKVEYVNCFTKVKIICLAHGEFEQIPHNHISHDSGCPMCARSFQGNRLRKPVAQWIEHCKDIHGEKYDYSRVEYVANKKEVIIICPVHGEFKQRAQNHYQGFGCAKCGSGRKGGKGRRLTTEQFIERSKRIYGEKYDYSKVEYVCNYEKVTIICPIHGEFKQIPHNHMDGFACMKCGKIRGDKNVNQNC